MKIAIVGANGYLARNLLQVAQQQGEYEITTYDRAAAQVDGYSKFQQVDILDPQSVRNIDLNVAAVFMMVGRTGTADGFTDYNEFIDANERALLNLLAEYRRQHSTARIIFPSTRLVYEGRFAPLDETAPKQFKTVYAIGKYAGEQYLQQFARAYGVRYTILRLCIPFGTLVPGASSYGTAEFMLSKARAGAAITLYGDGKLRRTFTYIKDVCDIMLRAAVEPACEDGIFNIGGLTYSLLEVAQIVAGNYGVGVEFVDWPPMALLLESGDTVFDDSRLTGAIGSTEFTTLPQWVTGSSPSRS